MIPEGNNLSETSEFKRPLSNYVSNNQKYLLKKVTYERQYATFYESRLKLSTEMLHAQAQEKWGSTYPIKHLCDVTGSEKVIVIGTVFKHMELHPSILKEISEEHNLIPQPVTEQFSHDDDYLILEDDLQQAVLCGNIDSHAHVTGITIAVLGYTEESGKFFVEDFCYSFVKKPAILPTISVDKYVLLVSGLSLGDANVLFPLQVLIDMIVGNVGEEHDQNKFSQLVRVIIAGNSICEQSPDPFQAKFLTRKSKATTVENVRMFDGMVSQLVSSVDVDVMPGEHDPANHLMPQQPLHPCMFPVSSQYSTFNVVTNPYDATIDGVRFVGSSGQNIKDISSYSKINDRLDVMAKTLEWGHISPTAPDSLNCYPFNKEDPFILTQYPHVYFCGNSSKYGVRYYDDKVLMLSIPKFRKTFCAVMLNLRNLHVEPIYISEVVT